MASWGRRRGVGGTCGVVVLLLSSACGLRVDPVATDVAVEASPPPPVVVASAEPQPTASPAPAEPVVAQSDPAPTAAATPAPPAPAPVPHGQRLWGRSFTSVAVQEDGQDRPLAAGTTVDVRFERREHDELVVWRAGCNGMGGVFRIDANRLTLIEDHGGTAASCGPDIDEQESWSREFFRAGPLWHLDGQRLVLRAASTVIRLEETTA